MTNIGPRDNPTDHCHFSASSAIETVPGDSHHVQLVTVFSASIPEETDFVDETNINKTETNTNKIETTVNGSETDNGNIQTEIADPMIGAMDIAEDEKITNPHHQQRHEQTHTDTIV